MQVHEAVAARRSIRAFLPDPVPAETLARVLRRAARAPSGGNLQPWHVAVLTEDAMTRFREAMNTASPGEPEYPVYPPKLADPWRSRRFAVGEEMYAALGVAREDKAGRMRWFARNADFFGAPAAIFVHVDRRMGAAQWSDLGMFLQTVMLLLVEEGYASCAQEAWAWWHETVDAFLGVPPERMLFCGLAIGKEDPAHPINAPRTARAPDEEWLRFV